MYLNCWRFQLLGGLAAHRSDDRAERFQNRKTSGLVGCLAYHAGQWLGRDFLVENVWPELPVDNGKGCLRVSIHSLRRRLEPPGVPEGAVIQATRTDLRLNADAIATDVQAFERWVEAAPPPGSDTLSALLELYKGPLLPGAGEEWVVPQRGRLEHLFVEQALASIEVLIAEERTPLALALLLEAIHRTPHAEKLHHQALLLYRLNGSDRDALAHYNGLKAESRVAWGCEAPPSLTGAVADLLRADAGASGVKRSRRRPKAAAPVPPSPPPARPSPEPEHRAAGRLPAILNRFFGRAGELDRVVRHLRPTSPSSLRRRLVTLTGPPGSGKTRLGLEAATRIADVFEGRIWFVRLGDLTAADDVPGEVAKAVGTSLRPGEDAAAAIGRTLGPDPALLILDNMDHVIGPCTTLLQGLLAAAPRLTVLATSRIPSDIEGEQLVSVQPLPVPRHGGAPDRLMEFASVEMLVDRARHVRPDFCLTPGNAQAITSICSLLDGLPLAIELAASRLSALTPQQVLAELDNRFAFLVSRRRTAEGHHGALEAAIGWSCSQLDDDTVRFFNRLSVFRGGWTLEAARAIWTGEPGNALDHLETLVRRSLVIAETEETVGGPSDMRYRMLVSLQDYARERLTGEEFTDAAELSARYFLELAERWEPLLRGGRAVEANAILARELHNFRESFRTLRESKEGLRMAAATWRLWMGQGLNPEAYSMLCEALRLHPNADSALRSAAHHGAGMIAYFTARPAEAREHAAEALRLAREAGSEHHVGNALNFAGVLVGDSGDNIRARELFEEALSIWRRTGDTWSSAAVLTNLGRLSFDESDFINAAQLHSESFGLFSAIGDPVNAATALMNLAATHTAQGDHRSSRIAVQRATDMVLQSGVPHDLGILYYNLGECMFRDCQHPDSARYLLDSIRIHLEQGNLDSIPYPLASLANVAAHSGDHWRAVQLHAAAAALRLKLQTYLPPDGLKDMHEDIEAIKVRLLPEDFDVAWRLGSAMTLDEAVALARQTPPPHLSPTPAEVRLAG